MASASGSRATDKRAPGRAGTWEDPERKEGKKRVAQKGYADAADPGLGFSLLNLEDVESQMRTLALGKQGGTFDGSVVWRVTWLGLIEEEQPGVTCSRGWGGEAWRLQGRGGGGTFESRGNNQNLNQSDGCREEGRGTETLWVDNRRPGDIPVSLKGEGEWSCHRPQETLPPWNQERSGKAWACSKSGVFLCTCRAGREGDTGQQNCPTGLECAEFTLRKGLIPGVGGRA